MVLLFFLLLICNSNSYRENCNPITFDIYESNADIYDDLISRRVHSSDAEKFAELCPCPCNGVAWGVIW